MTTYRRRGEHWTETKRVIGGVVKQVTCCCSRPAGKARECSDSRGLRSRCGCYCHTGFVDCHTCQGRGWTMMDGEDPHHASCRDCDGKGRLT